MHKIAFLLGGVEISGGVNVIFQHALHLSMKGYKISFITPKPVSKADIEWHPIHSYLQKYPNEISWYTFNQLSNDVYFDFAVATWWRTYFNLWKVNARQYLYFVQSIESRFYPIQETALRSVVESTYELNLGFITECNWISSYLYDNYTHLVPVALNGIDKKNFCENDVALERRSNEKLRVLVEGPLNVPFKNVATTIELASRSMADEIWLLTSSRVDKVDCIHKVYSQIPFHLTPTVYRSCDIVLKLSYVEGMFGPPLEMFHCGGTCIVYNVTGHDEYVINKENGLVVDTDSNEEVVQHINNLKTNPHLLKKLKDGARKTASEWPDWQQSNIMFENAITRAANQANVSREILKRVSKRIWHIYENKHT